MRPLKKRKMVNKIKQDNVRDWWTSCWSSSIYEAVSISQFIIFYPLVRPLLRLTNFIILFQWNWAHRLPNELCCVPFCATNGCTVWKTVRIFLRIEIVEKERFWYIFTVAAAFGRRKGWAKWVAATDKRYTRNTHVIKFVFTFERRREFNKYVLRKYVYPNTRT